MSLCLKDPSDCRFLMSGGMTQLIAALVPIHSVLAFLADMYCLLIYQLPENYHHFGPVDHMVIIYNMNIYM